LRETAVQKEGRPCSLHGLWRRRYRSRLEGNNPESTSERRLDTVLSLHQPWIDCTVQANLWRACCSSLPMPITYTTNGVVTNGYQLAWTWWLSKGYSQTSFETIPEVVSSETGCYIGDAPRGCQRAPTSEDRWCDCRGRRRRAV